VIVAHVIHDWIVNVLVFVPFLNIICQATLLDVHNVKLAVFVAVNVVKDCAVQE
jgi:hypothetical protein